ncbi:hypothetical protein ECZU15_10840 [Escherichia coli]|nr:hypothetical protein ECZU15_10840 [Escherichia coli]
MRQESFSGQERMYLIAACAMSFSEKSIIIINESNLIAIDYCREMETSQKLLPSKISIQNFHHCMFGFDGKEYIHLLNCLRPNTLFIRLYAYRKVELNLET